MSQVPPPGRSQSWFYTKLEAFSQAHNRLKHTVHNGFRYPLPLWGRYVMGCVYFSIPVVAGVVLYNRAIAKSDLTVAERFQDSESTAIQGLGNNILVKDESGDERMQKVGAGGWGGGVHLVTSDVQTQEANKVNLERFLRKQRRLMEKRERQAEEDKSEES